MQLTHVPLDQLWDAVKAAHGVFCADQGTPFARITAWSEDLLEYQDPDARGAGTPLRAPGDVPVLDIRLTGSVMAWVDGRLAYVRPPGEAWARVDLQPLPALPFEGVERWVEELGRAATVQVAPGTGLGYLRPGRDERSFLLLHAESGLTAARALLSSEEEARALIALLATFGLFALPLSRLREACDGDTLRTLIERAEFLVKRRRLVNTELNYLYRDGSNYKQSETVVLAGTITREHLEPYLDEGWYFIPSQVGLEDLQARFPSLGEDDHVWHELQEVTPTDAEPTTPMTAADLLARFRVVTWDEAAAMEQLGLEMEADGLAVEALARMLLPRLRQQAGEVPFHTLELGCSLRCGIDPAGALFIRACDARGQELAGCRWPAQELLEAPEAAPARIQSALARVDVQIRSPRSTWQTVKAVLAALALLQRRRAGDGGRLPPQR